MSVTPIERMNIIKYIKSTPFPTKTYGDLLLKMDRKKALGAQTIDLIEFLINYTYKETTQEKVSENLLRRELIIMFDVFNQINNIDSLLSEEQNNVFREIVVSEGSSFLLLLHLNRALSQYFSFAKYNEIDRRRAGIIQARYIDTPALSIDEIANRFCRARLL